ncbi:PREDICTED: uncharacterized protein LOC101302665 [Fragaria vesca subsp. vesca]|uniref:uncharacterized protein LOC101302665 n=1 Tax=Fragaria vesca subsp. vesca TaxID=101020 RepID=UPI0002C33A21|nr:PREDICTED: uncharacterized protein LOC101302665 [Fragaria vesca subsp. vesca]XP_011466045.1 PREDICTED: uncharacterized protein LOC101302665 [Fragaria vesca subsp. vesca]
MAYIPPHKRNSNEAERPVLTPDKLAPLFMRNVNVRSSKSNNKWGSKIIYADHAISKWWAVGLNDDTRFPSSVNLKPISSETIEHRIGEKPLALRNSDLDDGNEVQLDLPKSPWVYIAKNVVEDLLVSFENVKEEVKSPKLEGLKPALVARVGKILFHRTPSVTLESLGENLTTAMLKNWKKTSFYANVPVSYTEKIVNEVVPNIGAAFESEKDIYQVKLADSTKPDSTLSCKCSVKDGKLQLYKVELNQVRFMLMDMSIPNKNLDLRLMLNMKRVLTSQTDDEMQSIRDLVDSAITDPDVKGGLRWPLEKTSSGKYNVIGVWHVRAKAYKNQSLRFKVRHADRFDFITSSGEASWETSLRLKKVVSELNEEKVDVSSVTEMLEEDMKFIWDNFLTCESFLT